MLNFILGSLAALAVVIPVALLFFRRHTRRSKALERRARTSERMAYIDSLAGGLAHEIKNPLSTLSMTLQLLREDWKGLVESPIARRSRMKLEALLRETKRLEEILNDFLRYAKGEKLDLQDVQINDLISEVLDFINPEARANKITILRNLDESIPACPLDPKLIKQALLNIILNAQQAMPEGGDLIVQSKRLKDAFQIDITDTGSGIPAEAAPHIFDAYFSTKKGGTGLGLATTRRIIEEHGGTITFQSEVGKGTNFRILIPHRRD